MVLVSLIPGLGTFQAAQVQKICEHFNVEHIDINVTGVGYGVFDLVRDFYPRATPIHYSLETKNMLVLKAQDTIQARRIEWDAVGMTSPQPS